MEMKRDPESSLKRRSTVFPIEVFRQTLGRAVGVLESLGVSFHLTGGITSIAYSEPRMTQDIDLVIDPIATARVLDELLRGWRNAEFLLEEASAHAAVQRGGLFQLLDLEQALKIDVYARELIPGELKRSVRIELFEGWLLPVVCRVDAALSKLIWISKGSHKGRRDLRQIVRRASAHEARSIAAAARALRLEDLLQAVLDESDDRLE